MGSYQLKCVECGSNFTVRFPSLLSSRFCDKSCAASYRNRVRATASRCTLPPPPERGVRFIPLTLGKFARVDKADFADVSRWNWCAMKGGHGRGYYAARGRSPEEVKATGKRAPILMHRYLMGEPTEDIDHWNRDGLDNRRENMRLATPGQNGSNCLSRKGSSKFKGVSHHKGQWRVAIRSHYKTLRMGPFDTEEAAARAHDEAARRLHGEFARVNFPRAGERSALHD
jgi:hypothetical protein